MAQTVTLNTEQIREKASRWEMVKCPYCFKVFNPFCASFRAQSSFTEMDVDNGLTEEEKKYINKIDEKLVSYSGDKTMLPPVINFSEVKGYDVIVSNRFELDEDEFPSGIYDTLGNLSKKRICPHCHNVLPEKYGKYSVIFISVVGITKSGKTVYLSQLLNNINYFLPQFGIAISGSTSEMQAFIKEHPIRKIKSQESKKEYQLPDNTMGAILPKPIPLTIENIDRHKTNTIIFYDIAGENCVDPEKMEKYGPFIKNANGILMILDPCQFPNIFELEGIDPNGIYSPEMVVQTMYTSFLADDRERASQIPFAVAFSKSDLIRKYVSSHNYNNSYFDNIHYEEYGKENHGLALTDFEELSSTLQRILKDDETRLGENFINVVNNQFNRVGYFAFSSLNANPRVGEENDKQFFYLDVDPMCVRIEEPLAWLLYQLNLTPMMKKIKETRKKLFGPDESRIVVKVGYIGKEPNDICGGKK